MNCDKELINKLIFDVQSLGFYYETISMILSKSNPNHYLNKSEAEEIISNINRTKFRYFPIEFLLDNNNI